MEQYNMIFIYTHNRDYIQAMYLSSPGPVPAVSIKYAEGLLRT